MLSLYYRQNPSANLPEILKTAIERLVVYIARPISLGSEGLQLIVSGGQCSYQANKPKKKGKVKEIIHNSHDFNIVNQTKKFTAVFTNLLFAVKSIKWSILG
jgi:hypothetical protein